MQDSVSKQFGNTDGVSFCGVRKYELLDSELHETYLTLQGTEIIGLTVDNTAIGVH